AVHGLGALAAVDKEVKRLETLVARAEADERTVRIDTKDRLRANRGQRTKAMNRVRRMEQIVNDAATKEAAREAKIAWAYQNRYSPGSGLTDAEAAAQERRYARKLGEEKAEALADEVRAINSDRIAHMVETGIIGAETGRLWHEREPYWQSMKDLIADWESDATEDQPFRKIPGAQPRRKQIDAAEGRENQAELAFASWFEENLVRLNEGEKNAAIRTGLSLAAIEESGVELHEGPLPMGDGTKYVRFHDGGEIVHLKFESESAAAALKTMNEQSIGWTLQQIGKLTRLFSRNVTGRNPLFWVPNLLRDSTAAFWTVSAERSVKDGARVMGQSWAMLPKMIRHQLGRDTELADLIEEAELEGVKTTWSGHQRMEDHLRFLHDSLTEGAAGGAKAAAHRTVQLLEDVGDAFEMAVRVSSYKYERDRLVRQGAAPPVARRRAGIYAKNLTVNFDRKGTKTADVTALYAFFNPAVQGNKRLVEAALEGPRGAKAVGAAVLLGAVMEVLSYALSDEDEETGLSRYSLIPEWQKDRNLILPFEIGGVRAKVTLPYGLGAIFGLGRRSVHMAAGNTIDPTMTRAKAVQGSFFQMVGEWNPMGTASNPYLLLTPTVFRPGGEIYFNKKFGDAPIMPEQRSFGRVRPDSERSFSTIEDRASGWVAQRVADALNLGGPDEVPTGLDVSPESVQHLLDFALSSFGLRDLDRLSEFALSNRKVEPVNTIPILRQFAVGVQSHETSRLYYELRQEADSMEDWARHQDAERQREIIARNPRLWGLRLGFTRASRVLGKLRKQLDQVETQEEQEAARARMTQIQATMVRAYYRGA
ncbi:MAG: LPD38 domain-containing protein, partial [Planctomycetota bacterium]